MIRTYKHEVPKIKWGKSRTLPDQNYTVKELFQRFAKGLPIQASMQEPIYLGEENDVDLSKVKNMSIMDKSALADEMAEKAAIIDQDLTERKAKRSANAAKAKAETEAAKPPTTPPEVAKA